MEEKKFVSFKKEELKIKEYVASEIGRGKVSTVTVEYTPVGEKIIIATPRQGIVIGRRGEKVEELTKVLKKKFKLDNPHIEILEIKQPLFDARLVADEIALSLERYGSLKFKAIAYKMIQEIMKAGALGVEIVLSGRLPSERAKSWRFAEGYLKKTGDPAKVVDRAKAQAVTIQGVTGIKVSILPPNAIIHDQIIVNDSLLAKLKSSFDQEENNEVEKVKNKKKKSKNGGKR